MARLAGAPSLPCPVAGAGAGAAELDRPPEQAETSETRTRPLRDQREERGRTISAPVRVRARRIARARMMP